MFIRSKTTSSISEVEEMSSAGSCSLRERSLGQEPDRMVDEIMDSTSAVVSSRKCRKTSDRISNLPHNITERILECLPLQEAVKTSVLSSQWKYKWASISQIVLDKQFCTSFQKGRLETADISSAYSKAVNSILFSHIGPLRKLVLYVPSWLPEEADISPWIQYARANGVKEFTLENDDQGHGRLPGCMFSCVGLTELTHLELKSCKLSSLPSTFGGFPFLTSLKFETFKHRKLICIETDVMGMLISKCPRLQSLYLVIYETNDLTICAPKLKDLFVGGVLPNLCLKGTSTNTLALNIILLDFSEIFCCMTNVENLVLADVFWTAINYYESPVEILKKLERLQTLELVNIPLHCQYSIASVLHLFSNSPLLEQLYIEASKREKVQDDGLAIQIDDSFNLKCLRSIQIVCVSGMKSELQLIELLLANCSVLEKMTIKLAADMEGAEEKFDFAKETSRYRRASPFAELIIST